MAKTTKASLKLEVDEWAELMAQHQEIAQRYDALVAPHQKRFEKATKPIYDARNSELAPLTKRMAEIQQSCDVFLREGIGDDGSLKVAQIVGDKAIAEITAGAPMREIDGPKFFETFKDRTEKFWGCIKVLVTNADKAFGKVEVDKIAKKVTKYSTALKLKEPVATPGTDSEDIEAAMAVAES